jgi:hypothetical protein
VTYRDTTTKPTEHTLQSAAHDFSLDTDAQVAYQIAMLMRNDLAFEAVLKKAQFRILKLSAQLWELQHPQEQVTHGNDQHHHSSVA